MSLEKSLHRSLTHCWLGYLSFHQGTARALYMLDLMFIPFDNQWGRPFSTHVVTVTGSDGFRRQHDLEDMLDNTKQRWRCRCGHYREILTQWFLHLRKCVTIFPLPRTTLWQEIMHMTERASVFIKQTAWRAEINKQSVLWVGGCAPLEANRTQS